MLHGVWFMVCGLWSIVSSSQFRVQGTGFPKSRDFGFPVRQAFHRSSSIVEPLGEGALKVASKTLRISVERLISATTCSLSAIEFPAERDTVIDNLLILNHCSIVMIRRTRAMEVSIPFSR